MKFKRFLMPLAILSTAVSASALAAPSAKFAAVYSSTPKLSSMAVLTDQTADATVDVTTTGHTLATIKVPQAKELLVGLSAEIGLVTDTSVKGKNGGTASAQAGASAEVHIFAVPTGEDIGNPYKHAMPGGVMLSSRVQKLSATLAGVIQSCTDTSADGTIDVATECIVTDEEIGLMQDTTAAHHFNFVLKDMDAGEYDIVAVFTTGANVNIDICTSIGECALYDADGTVSGSATASAIVNQYMMTVQEVRAVKNDGVSAVDITTTECTLNDVVVACP